MGRLCRVPASTVALREGALRSEAPAARRLGGCVGRNEAPAQLVVVTRVAVQNPTGPSNQLGWSVFRLRHTPSRSVLEIEMTAPAARRVRSRLPFEECDDAVPLEAHLTSGLRRAFPLQPLDARFQRVLDALAARCGTTQRRRLDQA